MAELLKIMSTIAPMSTNVKADNRLVVENLNEFNTNVDLQEPYQGMVFTTTNNAGDSSIQVWVCAGKNQAGENQYLEIPTNIPSISSVSSINFKGVLSSISQSAAAGAIFVESDTLKYKQSALVEAQSVAVGDIFQIGTSITLDVSHYATTAAQDVQLTQGTLIIITEIGANWKAIDLSVNISGYAKKAAQITGDFIASEYKIALIDNNGELKYRTLTYQEFLNSIVSISDHIDTNPIPYLHYNEEDGFYYWSGNEKVSLEESDQQAVAPKYHNHDFSEIVIHTTSPAAHLRPNQYTFADNKEVTLYEHEVYDAPLVILDTIDDSNPLNQVKVGLKLNEVNNGFFDASTAVKAQMIPLNSTFSTIGGRILLVYNNYIYDFKLTETTDELTEGVVTIEGDPYFIQIEQNDGAWTVTTLPIRLSATDQDTRFGNGFTSYLTGTSFYWDTPTQTTKYTVMCGNLLIEKFIKDEE